MTFAHKFKCGYCSLHFTVYSFHEVFPPPHCPECGRQGSFLHWLERLDEQIYELVPGHAELVEYVLPQEVKSDAAS